MPRPKNKAWNEFPPSYYDLLERFKLDQSDFILTFSTRGKAETARQDLYHFIRVLSNSLSTPPAIQLYRIARQLTLSVQGMDGNPPIRLVVSWKEQVADRLAEALKEQST